MPASVHLDRGRGPVVVLLHGVGVGPESFATLAELLEDRHRVVVVDRPGGPGEAASLSAHADQIASLLLERGAEGGQLVGVSGGATLGLVIANRHQGCFGSLVLHEPLVGALAPRLHERFQQAAALAATGELGAMEVVRGVMGAVTWASLGPDGQAAAWSQAARWRDEIAMFASFDPSSASIEALRGTPLLTSLGARSGPDRHEAAAVLVERAGARTATVAASGNAAHLDAPASFGELITAWNATTVGGPR